MQSNPKTCLVFRQAPKCIVWIPFGLIDIFIWFGFSKASQGRLFEPYLWECDRRSLGSRKGLTQNRCRGLVGFVFLDYPSSKRVLTRGYHLIILHGSRQRKWKVLKTIKGSSVCDRRSMGRQKGLTQNRCRGLVCFVFE